MEAADFDAELDAERAVVERIGAAHRAHLSAAQRYASGLAQEASFLSEEGPRETEAESGDEDGEAAAGAASARAAAAQAVVAWKRARDLEAAGEALAFGRVSGPEETIYVGRTSVIDGDDILLVDWRAAAATPFYRATPLEPLGVTHRRHLHYDSDKQVIDYSDEIFDSDSLTSTTNLRGEAALLASLALGSDVRLRSAVATIQAEQDAVIRASAHGPLLVQGGPGTGKTVVALHRAAYLLYADRAALAETGILIVGPSPEFLLYISNVLPSLGESGVVSVTAERLHPGVRLRPDANEDAARLKGSEAMIKFLDQTVRDRQRQPRDPLVAWYGSRRLVIDAERLGEFFDQAQRHSTHNAGAGALRSAVLDVFVEEVFEPGFGSRSDIRNSLADANDVVLFMERHWPVLTPEQALNDVLGSPGLLASAAAVAGLSSEDVALLECDRTPEEELANRVWEHADVPLLDELHHVLGDASEALERDDEMEHTVVDEDDVFLLAEADDERIDLALDEDDDGESDVDHYDSWTEGDEEATWR